MGSTILKQVQQYVMSLFCFANFCPIFLYKLAEFLTKAGYMSLISLSHVFFVRPAKASEPNKRSAHHPQNRLPSRFARLLCVSILQNYKNCYPLELI